MSRQTAVTLTDDGDALPLPDVLTGRGLVAGKDNSGRAGTVRVLADELWALGVPAVLVDPDGAFDGLRAHHDVVHVGSVEPADVAIEPAQADALAEVVLEGGVPAIVDCTGGSAAAERELVAAVARALHERARETDRPGALVLGAADEFLPGDGGPADEAAETLGRVARRAPRQGLGVVAESRRPAALPADYLSQCDWQCWHRLTWEEDAAVVAKLLADDAVSAVRDLEPGQAILASDRTERREVLIRPDPAPPREVGRSAAPLPAPEGAIERLVEAGAQPLDPEVAAAFGVPPAGAAPAGESEPDDERADPSPVDENGDGTAVANGNGATDSTDGENATADAVPARRQQEKDGAETAGVAGAGRPDPHTSAAAGGPPGSGGGSPVPGGATDDDRPGRVAEERAVTADDVWDEPTHAGADPDESEPATSASGSEGGGDGGATHRGAPNDAQADANAGTTAGEPIDDLGPTTAPLSELGDGASLDGDPDRPDPLDDPLADPLADVGAEASDGDEDRVGGTDTAGAEASSAQPDGNMARTDENATLTGEMTVADAAAPTERSSDAGVDDRDATDPNAGTEAADRHEESPTAMDGGRSTGRGTMGGPVEPEHSGDPFYELGELVVHVLGSVANLGRRLLPGRSERRE